MPTKAQNPIPEGMNSLTTQLWFNGNCREAVDFYQKAFNAIPVGNIAYGPDSKSVIHAMLKIGDTNIMLADAMPGGWETGPEENATSGMYLYVPDCDKIYNQAISAGCKVSVEMMDAFWGDRMGKVIDPFGHSWSIATFKWKLSPEEIKKAQDDWMKSVKM